jgi:L-arabinose isomerase
MDEKEYIEREAVLESLDEEFLKTNPSGEEQLGFLKCRRIIREHTAADVVPSAAYEQMKWERDVAMQQLNDAGIPFCGERDRKRDEFFVRYLGKFVGECMCRETSVIQNGRDESKEEEQ